MNELATRRCGPLPAGTPPLRRDQIDSMLASLPGWAIQNGALVKTFSFADYYETLAFVNALAWIAHREDHHPELVVGYNRCRVEYSTHSVGGLSENDFICAAKVEALQNS